MILIMDKFTDPPIDEHLAVDISKFQRDLVQIPFHHPQHCIDTCLFYILLTALRNDDYLARLTEHEPEDRREAFLNECCKLCIAFTTRTPLVTPGVFPGRAEMMIHPQQFSVSVFVEYLTLFYSSL
jgi:hypothetical protein